MNKQSQVQQTSEPINIVVFGQIGAGKSTQVNLLEKNPTIPSFTLLIEPFEQNWFLQQPDKEKYFFQMEQQFIVDTFTQQKSLQPGINVLDRDISSTMIFIKANHDMGRLNSQELKLLEDTYNILSQQVYSIGSYHFIYLYVDSETCMRRIEERGREFERSYTLEYLEKLEQHSEAFFQALSLDKVKLDVTSQSPQEVQLLVAETVRRIIFRTDKC